MKYLFTKLDDGAAFKNEDAKYQTPPAMTWSQHVPLRFRSLLKCVGLLQDRELVKLQVRTGESSEL